MEKSGFDKMSKRHKIGFVKSSIKNSYNRAILKKELPKHLVNVVTWKCNSKCKMCNIWKKKNSQELSISEYDKIFSDKQFWSELRTINMTGGEPFLRKDIVDLTLLLEKKCPKIEMISFSSNGFMPKIIIERIKEILEKKNKKTKIGITISLDGIGEDHDKIRGINGAFNLAIKSIEELKKIEKKNKSLILTTETVVFSDNSEKINEIRDFLKNKNIHNSLAIISFQDSYYNNLEKKKMSLTKNEILKLFKRRHFIDYYIKKQVRDRKRYLPCGAGKTTLTIMPEGDIYFCQFLKKIGNIKKENISKIWSSEDANKQRRIIKKADICKDCYFSCDIYSSIESSFKLTFKIGLVQYFLKWRIINDR